MEAPDTSSPSPMPGAIPWGWDLRHLPCGRDTGWNNESPAEGTVGRGEQTAHHQEEIGLELTDPLAKPEPHIV